MKVDFYVLEVNSRQQAWLFVCQLLEKMYAEQKRVYVHTRSAEEAERFDNLLWTFKEDSFIPHQLYTQENPQPAPIQIGQGQTPCEHVECMLNLCPEIPPFYQQFQHIIEIVFSDVHMQQLARERYKHYRDQGCEINTHKLTAAVIAKRE